MMLILPLLQQNHGHPGYASPGSPGVPGHHFGNLCCEPITRQAETADVRQNITLPVKKKILLRLNSLDTHPITVATIIVLKPV